VFCIDLDGFKAVNDQLGHDAGDELLRAVALRLRGRIRHSDTLARMGGDEFLAIIEECSGESSAKAVADSLIAALTNPAMTENGDLMISASVGIALYPGDGKNASQLRRNADQAMYRAKSSGGGRSCFWASDPESPGKALPAKAVR
jgi:diguanylate cyclase (GGDEF)-like protein